MGNQFEVINKVIFEEARKLMGARFSTMVQYFQEDVKMYLEEMKKSVIQKNAHSAILPAHTIKSSAKQIGIERLSEIAKQIEFLSIEIKEQNSQDYTGLEKLVCDLEEEFNLVKLELNKLCKNI